MRSDMQILGGGGTGVCVCVGGGGLPKMELKQIAEILCLMRRVTGNQCRV